MALRQIRYECDEILRKKAKPVKKFDDKLCELLDDMRETMAKNNGVGLAATQVGMLKRAVVIDVGDGGGVIELVNPVISETEGEQERPEGCLSLPGKRGIVKRPVKTKVTAFNRSGEQFEITGEALLSVALNHEIDHLDGVLYVDKVIRMCDPDEEFEDDDEAAEPDGGTTEGKETDAAKTEAVKPDEPDEKEDKL